MKMDIVAGSGQDEFYTPSYAILPIIKYLKEGSTIWCPFDTEESLYYKELSARGYNVVCTHLSRGQDFFEIDIDCDYIVSNPPYSIKGKVFERLFNLKKPFAMLVGVVGLFESQYRFNMFKENTFEIMYLNKRISYFKNYDDQKPSLNPPFSSVYLTSQILPSKIVFEEVFK